MKGSPLLLALLLLSPPAGLADEGPWSVSAASPVFAGEVSLEKVKIRGEAPPFDPFILLVRGFQEAISPVDGDRCTLYPTCSAYAVEALRRHGTLKGLIMTADRLMHEADEGAYAPIIVRHGHYRFYDPVEGNDLWRER